jgi:hypothetical protein
MQTIPLQPVPSQSTKVVLGGQNCQIQIYQMPRGIFVDVNVDGTDVVLCVMAHDADPIICRTYLGFIGNLLFIDSQGNGDPTYDGLGSRYQLLYLTDAEYALI